MPSSTLEVSIYNTLRYFALFDMPLTATQVWRTMVGGEKNISLHDVQEALEHSAWLRPRVSQRWGYFSLVGEAASVERRLARHVLSQAKWRITRRITRFLVYVPFVRMIAGSGSLSLSNTQVDSDLDLFVIVEHGHIWTARLLLLLITHLSGRRRKYWNEKAPDRICLNHYITDESLLITPDNRSLYTAMLYTHLTVLHDEGGTYQKFMAANEIWVRKFVSFVSAPPLASVHAVKAPSLLLLLKRLVESWLRETALVVLEHWAESVQRRTIVRHTRPGRAGRVVISSHELAFHPDSKAEQVGVAFPLSF